METTSHSFFDSETFWTWTNDQLKTNNWSTNNFNKKQDTLMCSTLEPAIQLCDTGQRITFLTAVN